MADFGKWAPASPREPVADVARRSLQTRLEAVLTFLEQAATRWSEDPEYVHQMRVWSRRTVAALDLYEPLLPPQRRKRLKKHVQRIRRAANDARDDDVFAERLARDEQDPAARQLLETVREHRQQAQQPIVAVYEQFGHNGRLARRITKLLKRTGAGPRKSCGTEPFHPWAAKHLNKALHDFFQAADQELDQWNQLHRLRIAGKQLRYTVELLSAAFPDPLRTQIYPRIRDLQDRLGIINDHATAHHRLQRWSQDTAADSVQTYLQQRVAIEAGLAAECHQQFLVWWNTSRATELQQAFAEILPTEPS